MEFVMGLGLALPIVTSTGISVTTGVAQGVSEQKKQNADAANQTRMLKFHVDVWVDPKLRKGKGAELNNAIVTLRQDKLWVEAKSPITRLPEDVAHHPFTGFYLAYPDDNRPYTRGLVSTISVDPPMLNWIYVDKDTLEVKYASRSGSIQHHVGSFDWTTEESEDSSITFDDWEGFLAVEEGDGKWALYFDLNDDGLKEQKKGRKTVEISLMRRVISEQETNKWGLAGEGNIGFRKTREGAPVKLKQAGYGHGFACVAPTPYDSVHNIWTRSYVLVRSRDLNPRPQIQLSVCQFALCVGGKNSRVYLEFGKTEE